MSTILDKNEQPVSNGQNHGRETHDVRTIPTGTLIFNLIRFAGEEIGVGNMIHQIEAAKQQQKLVTDPPQLTKLREHLEALEQHRFLCAKELNERFSAIDKMRIAQLGIEVVEPKAVEPETVDPQPGNGS